MKKKTITIKTTAIPFPLSAALERDCTQKQLNEICRELGIPVAKWKWEAANRVSCHVHNNRDKVALTITIDK